MPGALHTMWAFLKRTHAFITKVPPSLEHAQKIRARFLIHLIVLSVPLGLAAVAARAATDDPFQHMVALPLAGCLLVAAPIWVCRRGHIRVAGWLLVGATMVATALSSVAEPDRTTVVGWGSAAIVVAAVVLSAWETVLLSVLSIGAAFLSALMIPGCWTPRELHYTVAFLAIITVLSVLGNRMVRQIEADRAAQLKASEARHRSLLETTFDGVLVVQNQRVVEASAGVLELLGLPADKVVGEPLSDVLRSQGNGERLPTTELEEGQHSVVVANAVSGTSLALELSARTLPHPGGPSLFVAVRNVTRQRAAEAQLKASERAISLGQIAASLTHEINNPLTYILANLELLERAGPQATELKEAREGAERIQALIQDILQLARAPTGSGTSVNVEEVVHSALRMTAQLVACRARPVVQLGPAPNVMGHAGRLGQVLVNLINNAANAMASGHPAEHRLGVSLLTGADGRVCIEVSDTGPGIPPNVLPRIFDPFYSGTAVGTGLGLSISQRIVEDMGGELKVATSPQGSTFTVFLPAMPAPEPATVPAAQPQLKPPRKTVQGQRILLVDDEPMVLRALHRALKGNQISTAESGTQALELCRQQSFDIILADMMMPGCTGMELHQQLEADGVLEHTPFVIMSGGAITEPALAFMRDFGGLLLPKPITLKELHRVVEAATGVPRGTTSSADMAGQTAHSSGPTSA